MKNIRKFLLSALATISAMLCMTSLAYADSPRDNGSSAKTAVEQQMPGAPAKESSAMPDLILYTVGGGVVTIALIAGAIIIGNRNNGKKDENAENGK